jgi:hypothetical protein
MDDQLAPVDVFAFDGDGHQPFGDLGGLDDVHAPANGLA